jgi:rhodanese-related sulfurtransferase
MNKISPQSLREKQSTTDGSALRILDVRTPAEHEEAHIEGSDLHPLEVLNAEKVSAKKSEDPIYVLCQSGNRATQAIKKLNVVGMENLVLVEGGIRAWINEGYPVTRGKKTIPLERQVRIAAGVLVLLGAILGFTHHAFWHGLSGFVGAGLIFAGITDTCGMAMFIAKMPWNQRTASCPK